MRVPAIARITLGRCTPKQLVAWEALGFRVERPQPPAHTALIRFDNLEIGLDLSPSEDTEVKSHVQSWSWRGIASSSETLCTIPLSRHFLDNEAPNSVEHHRNHVNHVDHIVLRTTDCHRLGQQLDTAGFDMARLRDDIYPGITQMFYKTGGPSDNIRGPFLEVVGPTPEVSTENTNKESASFLKIPSETSEYKVTLWGLGLESSDIDQTFEEASPLCSKVRSAFQKGKKIITLKPDEELGLALAVLSRRKDRPGATTTNR